MPAPCPSVTLRRVQADDVPMILAMEADPAVMRHSTGIKPATEARRQELLTWLREPLTDIGHWTVLIDGAAVGWVSLVPLEDGGRLQLAYRLCRAAWGQGYATQAARLLCDYAWRALDVPELVAVVWPDNHASVRVLEKLGFAFSAHERHYDRPTAVYALPRPAA
ncbi:GNAT family N-acetyltransferase [Achromobacter marplatensis]|uniref:GNAT family N-acetyltransferase n=1 Tax=Achromobacter marplatensis TaxID=470868 RepID=UPI0028E666E4|nr:GNAT family N-acetyltransferase [Achromobacter marplatensis]